MQAVHQVSETHQANAAARRVLDHSLWQFEQEILLETGQAVALLKGVWIRLRLRDNNCYAMIFTPRYIHLNSTDRNIALAPFTPEQHREFEMIFATLGKVGEENGALLVRPSGDFVGGPGRWSSVSDMFAWPWGGTLLPRLM